MMRLSEVDTLVATVDDRVMAGNWPVVASEHPRLGPPGLDYRLLRHHTGGTVDCLILRDRSGRLEGLLYHYRDDFPPFERRGNVNMWVDSAAQRRGLGSYLVGEADRRGKLDFAQQSYTTSGLALVQSHLSSVVALSP